jgi:flavin-dependent dehydrogenase
MPDFLTTEYVAETLPRTMTTPRPEMPCDVLVIGAGPTGLACAIDAQRIGLKVIVVDKGCLVNSLFHYPAGMVFFTTPELLEIGDIPFTTSPINSQFRARNCPRFRIITPSHIPTTIAMYW